MSHNIIASFTYNDFNNETRYVAHIADDSVYVRINDDYMHIFGNVSASTFNGMTQVAWIEYIEQMFDTYTKDDEGNVVRRDTWEG